MIDSSNVMDVENVNTVDGLVFGYLIRRQYYETLRALCNEAPSLRGRSIRLRSDNDVFIHVNDQLHDMNLEQIISAFSVVGRFDVTPELIDFGIRLRDLTNEFSTMTSVRGRSISDNQMKLYGKRSFTKTVQARQAHGSTSLQSFNSQSDIYRPTVYCESQIAKESDYTQQFHNTCMPGSNELIGGQQFVSQQELNYEYESQPQTSAHTVPVVSPYVLTQPAAQNSAVTTAKELSSQSTPTYTTSHLIPHGQLTLVGIKEPMLIDYGVNLKTSTTSDIGPELDLETAHCSVTEGGGSGGTVQTQLSSSFSGESGAHKRKSAVPHRRDELVAHTAQSLIIPNGVLVDLDSNGIVNSTSQVSLLSNIDDSAMQCLDRLINGNLDEVFPFCEDNDELNNLTATICNPYCESRSNDNELAQLESQPMFNESAPCLDVDPSVSLPLDGGPSSKSRALDEGEIISDESLNMGNSQKPVLLEQTDARSGVYEVFTAREHLETRRNDLRRSSLDSGKEKRFEKKVADRLKEFNRNPPKRDIRVKKFQVDKTRTEIPDAVIHEARNVPLVSPSNAARGQTSRSGARCFTSLLDEACSVPSSRESSPPQRDRVKRKEEERRRREKEMERERQRDKERLKRQRRDLDPRRDKERFHRPSPDRKLREARTYRREDAEKGGSWEKERKRDFEDESKFFDDSEKKRAEEKAKRESQKKRKEEELEVKRQSEQQRRAEAMRRKEEEEKKRREDKGRQEEKKQEDERRHLEEDKLQKKKEEEQRKEDELRNLFDGDEQVTNYADEGRVTVKSSDEVDRDSVNSACDSSSSDAQYTARNYSDDETATRRDFQTQENRGRFYKAEVKKVVEPLNRPAAGSLENDEDAVAVENEERIRKPKEEVRTSRIITGGKKSLPPSAIVRRREEMKKVAVKPLEPGMMMSDTGVLDRINKEMESLVPRSARSPDESSSIAKNTYSSKAVKRDTSVDYNQILFSNPPVIKRTLPAAEKRKVFVISSGLSTGSTNHLVFSKAHSSRLGMFLEKVSDKHRKFMDRENDRVLASPACEDSDRNDVRSPVIVSQFPRQQQQKFAPQKRPLPASSLDSYLGSPTQNSPDNRDGEVTTTHPSGKKSKIDMSKMPDIIEKLYGGKSV